MYTISSISEFKFLTKMILNGGKSMYWTIKLIQVLNYVLFTKKKKTIIMCSAKNSSRIMQIIRCRF